jgi:hypothetical protein
MRAIFTRLQPAIPWILAALGAVSAIAQILGMGREVALPLLALVLVAMAAYWYRTRRVTGIVPSLPRSPVVARPDRFRVKQILKDDLYRVWQFENAVYGPDNVSLNTVRQWLSRYPHAAFLLEDATGEVAGTFAMYPVGRTPFLDVLEGARFEDGLSAHSIKPPKQGGCDAALWSCRARSHSASVRRAHGNLRDWMVKGRRGSPQALRLQARARGQRDQIP